ncbi:PIR protein, putative [Plasmodium sp.]|nr:PIR protein, putative [Plasmodium sp.]
MKFSYTDILLFSLSLYILLRPSSTVNNQSIYNSTTLHTPNNKLTKTNRSLCECNLYTSIYDNDPEIQKVMDNFNRQTSQKFIEYEKRMNKNRQKRKEQCDKDIQKIILKDKIEKELVQHLSPLETNIDTDDIPNCLCKKSLADKVEKTCLKCGGILVTAVPDLGVLGGYGVNSMVQAAIAAGMDFATKKGLEAGTQAGIQAAIQGVINKFGLNTLGGKTLQEVITSKTYNEPMFFSGEIISEYILKCDSGIDRSNGGFRVFEEFFPGNNDMIMKSISASAGDIAKESSKVAANETSKVTSTFSAQKTAEATSATTILSNPIVISFIVLVIIIIILLIIYLILRYRRKNKMKKKLQYIKLLKE